MWIRLCCVWLNLLVCGPTVAADFSLVEKSVILMEGEIVVGDFARLKALSKSRLIDILKLRSPGGDVIEALKISDFLNDKLITAKIPLTLFITDSPNCSDEGLQDPSNCVCYSACSVIWMTAPMRMGDYIGVHRPRFDNKYFANLNANEAQAKYSELINGLTTFLRQHDVPESIVTKMMSVSSGDNYMLQEQEVKSVGAMRPFLDEMLLARCADRSAGYAEWLSLNRALDEVLNDPSSTPKEINKRTKALLAYKDRYGFSKCTGIELKKIRAERQGI
jgi:hypothetical protein